MRRFRLLAVGLALLIAGVSTAYAATGAQNVVIHFRSISLWVHGRQVATDGVEPFIYNDRTYVPARRLAEALGADVSWDAEKQRVVVNGRVRFERMEVSSGTCEKGKCVPSFKGFLVNGAGSGLRDIAFVCKALGPDGQTLAKANLAWGVSGVGRGGAMNLAFRADNSVPEPVPPLTAACEVVNASYY